MPRLPSRSNTQARGKRAIIACNECNIAKTACSGGESCKRCVRKRVRCVYPEGRGNVVVGKGYLHALEARNKTLEGIVAGMKEMRERGVEGEAGGTDRMVDGVARFVLSPSGEHSYLGAGSSTYFSLELRDILSSKADTKPNDPEVEQPTYDDAAWPLIRPQTSIKVLLPPYDIAQQLFAAQHQYIGTIFSFVSPSTFRTSLQCVYHSLSPPSFADRDTCLLYAQVLLVFAYGQMYSINRWTSHAGPPGFEYFTQALSLLPDIREAGSVLFVEVLALVGYFYQNLNRRDTALLYIGHALRMAISLGLHQEVPSTTVMDDSTRERRRRVWWSVYSMDRILCCKSGNPLTISDKDISVRQPSVLASEHEVGSEHEPPEDSTAVPAATTLALYTHLSRILGRIAKRIYRRPRARPALEAAVLEIMGELARWEEALPEGLSVDFSRGCDAGLSRERVSVYLHYHQCVIMTARPLLLGVVAEKLKCRDAGAKTKAKGMSWKRGVVGETVGVVEACVRAARNSVVLLANADSRNLVATYGFMDSEHAFSAALVLAMSDLALRTTAQDAAALKDALRILKDMARRGDLSKLRSRCALLESLVLRRRDTEQTVTTEETMAIDGRDAKGKQVQTSVVTESNGESCGGSMGGDSVNVMNQSYVVDELQMDDFVDWDWDLRPPPVGEDGIWFSGLELLQEGNLGREGHGGVEWDFGEEK